MLRQTLRLLSLGLLLLVPMYASGQAAASAPDIPTALRDWQGWVLHDQPERACPLSTAGGDHQCVWPGRLNLDAGASGASFTFDVRLDAPGWVALPGGSRAWPQNVSANQQPAIVLERNGQPRLWLPAGDYQLRGSLPWSERPARVDVPAMIGLVTLRVDGVAVSRVERNGDQLTLGESAAQQRAADALSLRVYRQLQDGLPALLETRLQLDVTGGAREVSLGPALPAGFVATAVSGELPARLEADGRLRVQLRPGKWTITLNARSTAPLADVAVQLPVAPWPQHEVWSYADDTVLRGTRVLGSATDADQAGVPADWSNYPAYTVNNDDGLIIEQGTRGDEGAKGDQLRLRREMWLDFNGKGLTVADHLTGELRHHQRLDVSAPWQLQRAELGGVPLLVTQGEQGGSGVEIREQNVDLHAGLRLADHAGALPSSGWQLPLEGIDATLHLPSGYRLLGAIGADRSPDSWVGQWNLLNLFALAVIALLAGRLLGWPWAAVAAIYLALGLHEDGSLTWLLGAALALALILRALPEGRLRKVSHSGAIAVCALAALWFLPFAAQQLRYTVYPQLEGRSATLSQSYEVAKMPPPPMPAAPPPASAPIEIQAVQEEVGDQAGRNLVARQARPRKVATSHLSSVTLTSSAYNSNKASLQQDSSVLIQAGRGMPAWNVGNNYRLGWAGPVTVEQTSRLVIAPTWLVRVLRVLMIGLLAALLGGIARELFRHRGQAASGRGGWAGMATASLLAVLLVPSFAHAQATPSEELLEQLQTRLVEAPECAPRCVSIPQAQLLTQGNTLELMLEAHAGAAVAMPLPQPDSALQLVDASVDGRAAPAMVRDGGRLLLRLDRGVHRVNLRYRIASSDSASLQFTLRPQRVSLSGSGWSLDGVDDGRALGDSIALHRDRAEDDEAGPTAAQAFPPYVRLERTLIFGLDWRVENFVRRIAPSEGGFSTSLPLLPGEHPLNDDTPVEKGAIRVTFNAGTDEVRWSSRLDQAATMSLKAASLGDRAETWRILASPMWHVEATGVPTSESGEGLFYQPLPDESLALALRRPVAVEGDSLAFDKVSVVSEVGQRAVQTSLTLSGRSTRGGEHLIDLPAGAELLEAKRDGVAVNLAVREGKLGLPLLPGAHSYQLQVRQPQQIAARMQTPTFNLNAPAANIEVRMDLPQDRWLLWTWGPTNGPAVLYWSQLLVLLMAAWLLGRFAPTPLRFHQWLLLGLGFSAVAWTAFAFVAAWMILLGVRARTASSSSWGRLRFNAQQTGLAVMTVVALLVLIVAVPRGLLGLPDMHVAGNGSSDSYLRWFADQSAAILPQAGVLSVSMWVYKIAMLGWALWLAWALISWLQWGFQAWTKGGYWRAAPPKNTPPPMPGEDPSDGARRE